MLQSQFTIHVRRTRYKIPVDIITYDLSGKGTRAHAITKRSKMGALVTLWLKCFGFSGYSHHASPDLSTIV